MRQLCPHCKTACVPPLRPIETLFEHVTGTPPRSRAAGCKQCDYTGYHGRFPVVEALEIPDEMRSQLLRGKSDADALTAAIPGQWRSMESNAANWVISGLTTPDEAFDCLGLRMWTTLARKAGVDAPIAAMLGPSEGGGAQGASQATALIISTHAPLIEVLSSRLEHLGQVPLVVDSPLAAAQALQREHHLQLLVVDITEPDPQRRAYAQELRASLAWSGLRTLVIYDAAEAGIVERMESFGIHSYLPAPLDEPAFEAKVAHLISRG